MKLWKTVPFSAAFLLLQGQAPLILPPPTPQPGTPAAAASEPLYRITLVQGSAKAVNYRELTGSTKVALKGTALAPKAEGKAKIHVDGGGLRVALKVKGLPLASSFGGEYLTYVLWGISPEGRATNLGELPLKNGKGRVKALETLRSFGLVVTAEPYFAVTQPSDAVILENVPGEGTKGQVEPIEAKYELLKRGQYALDAANAQPLAMDKKTPFEVYQARNAVRIARAAGAPAFAQAALSKSESYLALAEKEESGRDVRIQNAREAVQRAEDARTISCKRQEDERVAMDQALAKNRLEEAKRAAEVAKANADQAIDAKDAATSRTRGVEEENAALRTKLMDQLSSVLKTRATARGLIVNMSGMLFRTGKSDLAPAAREKLAKVAGILAAHKGLRIEVEGFTDSTGSETFNQKLSESRAQVTRDYLVSQGVASSAVTSKGCGEADPIASNATESGRKENRRVELVVSGGGLSTSDIASKQAD